MNVSFDLISIILWFSSFEGIQEVWGTAEAGQESAAHYAAVGSHKFAVRDAVEFEQSAEHDVMRLRDAVNDLPGQIGGDIFVVWLLRGNPFPGDENQLKIVHRGNLFPVGGRGLDAGAAGSA